MAEGREKVCVIGLWHLGSVTAACLAELGHQVVGVDPDAGRVEGLKQGSAPLYEPGLNELLLKNLSEGRLSFTTDAAEALKGATYALISYDSPVDERDEVDLSPVLEAASHLARHLEDGATVVISSQVPVGTCEEIAADIRAANPSRTIGVAYTPENLRLGQAIERFLRPDMVVIGADSEITVARVDKLLAAIQAPRVKVDLRTAEMVKHAINAFLATSISFINEIANLSDQVGADALKVAKALRLDSRIGPRAPLHPGLAFAGGTLARDLRVLRRIAERESYEAPLINAVLTVNERQNGMVIRKLRSIYPSLAGLRVGVLGLTYKPGTSTLRRSPSLEIIRAMRADGVEVKAYDPKADPEEVRRHAEEFTICPDPYAVAESGHALLLVTAWPDFRELDFPRIRSAMERPVLLDPQNILDADAMVRAGFSYYGTGQARATLRREGT